MPSEAGYLYVHDVCNRTKATFFPHDFAEHLHDGILLLGGISGGPPKATISRIPGGCHCRQYLQHMAHRGFVNILSEDVQVVTPCR
jgi:hypothetical protein